MFPIKFKIHILDLMLLPKDSVPFEGQYYSNWIFPMHIDTISMELSIVCFKGHGYNCLNHDVRGLSQKVVDFRYNTRLCIRNSMKFV